MALRQLIEFITPTPCLGCGREGSWLCDNCCLETPIPRPVCFACGRLTDYGLACEKCRRKYSLAGVVVGAHYDGPVKDLVLALKFHRAAAGARPAAALITRALPQRLVERLEGVTSVPVAPGRRRERGYNQAELIAKRIASDLDIPYRPTLRRQGVVHQLGAGRRDRFNQVREVFGATTQLEGRWLIVDDVVTTGATLDACAYAMRQAGARAVYGAVVAGQHG